MKKAKSRRTAIIISYCAVTVSALSNLLLTRLYISYLGLDAYGHYQMINAIGQYILLFDFGIMTAVMRFRVVELERKDKKRDENMLFHCFMIVLVLMFLVVMVGTISLLNVGRIYPSLSLVDVFLSQHMMIFLILNIIVTLAKHYLLGIVMSEERYVFAKGIDLALICLRLVLISAAVVSVRQVIVIFYVDFAVSLFFLLVTAIYIFKTIAVKIKFHYIDLQLLKTILFLMMALMLQSIATYVNTAADKTILGIMMNKSDVAMYTFAITINSFFATIPNAINSTYVPTATQMIVNHASTEELTDLVIRPGRLQYMFCGAVVAGFILYGRFFLHLWTGQDAYEAWICAVLLIVTHLFPLVQNVCLSILTAMNKRLVRSLIVVGTSVINIILTVIFVHRCGIIGAAIGTAISVVIGNVLLTNIYYKKVIGLNVFRMYRQIFSHTTLCIVVASLASSVTLLVNCPEYMHLILGIVLFTIVYVAALLLYGMNDSEKVTIESMIKTNSIVRFIRRKNGE